MDTPNLAQYDRIIVNSSAGKDSQAMLHYVCQELDRRGIARSKILVVHSDLGRVEWKGTKALAERQAAAYGVQFVAVKRPQGDLLQHIEQRGMWPSPKQRYCTSDHKRGQIAKVFTRLTRELYTGTPLRFLNCMGLRAEESPARAKKPSFQHDARLCTSQRIVDTWLPIQHWSTAQVWQTIRASGVPYHPAYDLGMPRLSCIFCIFAPKDALVLAAKHNPELLEEYVQVERRINHTFRQDITMAEIQRLAQDTQETTAAIGNWRM